MVYNPATDFFGLWRNNGANVSKMEMPGLDAVVAALARAGLITLSVSATAPVVNQSTTAWLQAAVPSYSAEGVMRLWDPITTAYVAATPALLFEMLQTSAGQNGVSWYTSAGGPPANIVGLNGDFAIRTDEPGGIYGPKAAGAWPATPLPGTTNEVTSIALDNTFGTAPGLMIYRGAATWDALPIGAAEEILSVDGTGLPAWDGLSHLLDIVFGATRGSILFRGAALWSLLGPGTSGYVLSTLGVGLDPLWTPRTAEFPSGTSMVFRQTAAPPGWTKQVALNDYGLRVVSGAAGTVAGTAFSTVFAQTTVGNTTLTTAQMPSHTHTSNAQLITGGNVWENGSPSGEGLNIGATIDAAGGGGAHTHSVQLALSYVDVIIATKD